MDQNPCPCGSGAEFGACCGPILDGAAAPTAERLMRSRFTAFARGDRRHLLASWHASTRPRELDLDDGPDGGVVWRRLQIVDTAAGGEHDDEGVVEFRASYRSAADGAGVLHERSRFAREGGAWRYVDGELLD